MEKISEALFQEAHRLEHEAMKFRLFGDIHAARAYLMKAHGVLEEAVAAEAEESSANSKN